MPRRHVLAARQRLDVERARVLAIDPVAHAAQPDQLRQPVPFVVLSHKTILASASVSRVAPAHERIIMAPPLTAEPGFLRSVRTFLGIAGAITLVAGLVLLIWPQKSAVIVTGIFASYLIVSGLVYLG
jgi:hypothetical protein